KIDSELKEGAPLRNVETSLDPYGGRCTYLIQANVLQGRQAHSFQRILAARPPEKLTPKKHVREFCPFKSGGLVVKLLGGRDPLDLSGLRQPCRQCTPRKFCMGALLER